MTTAGVSAEESPGAPPRVLLVDDEEAFRQALGKVLRGRGIDTREAPSGRAALEALSDFRAEVVVLDLKMPELDGLATLREIHRHYRQLHVILLTGHGTVQAGLDAVRHLAYDFLLKPVPPDRLIQVITAAVEDLRRRWPAAPGARDPLPEF